MFENNILGLIPKDLAIDNIDLMLVSSLVEEVSFPKREIISRSGNVQQYCYFQVSGFSKIYKYVNDQMVVDHLIEPGQFFTSFDSFLERIPSQLFIETVTESKLFRLSRENFETMNKSSVDFSKFVQQLIHNDGVKHQKRLDDFQTLSAKDRYEKFIAERPHIMQEFSIADIASYLGIQPQSLSRIRAML